MNKLHAHSFMFCHWGRKSYEGAIVEVVVGESDQFFVFATVMPAKGLNGQSDSHALVENAVENLGVFVAYLVPVDVFKHGFLEKGCRRQLLVVTSADDGFSTIYSPNSVLGNYLRRFVKENQIELHQLRGEELANRDWAHEQAGFDTGKDVGDSLQQIADRHQSSLFRCLSQ